MIRARIVHNNGTVSVNVNTTKCYNPRRNLYTKKTGEKTAFESCQRHIRCALLVISSNKLNLRSWLLAYSCYKVHGTNIKKKTSNMIKTEYYHKFCVIIINVGIKIKSNCCKFLIKETTITMKNIIVININNNNNTLFQTIVHMDNKNK